MIDGFDRITKGPDNQLFEVDDPTHNKQETKTVRKFNGCLFLLFHFFIFAIGGVSLSLTYFVHWTFSIIAVISFIVCIICFFGYFTVKPNSNSVVMFYGKYQGVIKEAGYFWINPFYNCENVSLRASTLNSPQIKINDKDGIPILAKCTLVWKVVDPYKALYEIQNYNGLVHTQSESALRYVGCQFPYDIREDEICLKYRSKEIDQALKEEMNKRIAFAGLEVQEARITEISISPEVANIMLRTQVAEAVLAAREKIVEGAVGIVQDAVNAVKVNNICEMPPEKKAKLVSNMLLVLCSESQVTPIIKL